MATTTAADVAAAISAAPSLPVFVQLGDEGWPVHLAGRVAGGDEVVVCTRAAWLAPLAAADVAVSGAAALLAINPHGVGLRVVRVEALPDGWVLHVERVVVLTT